MAAAGAFLASPYSDYVFKSYVQAAAHRIDEAKDGLRQRVMPLPHIVGKPLNVVSWPVLPQHQRHLARITIAICGEARLDDAQS